MPLGVLLVAINKTGLEIRARHPAGGSECAGALQVRRDTGAWRLWMWERGGQGWGGLSDGRSGQKWLPTPACRKDSDDSNS